MLDSDPVRDGTIPKIGLGTYHKENPGETRQTVEMGLKIGYRHIDTAQYYDNEEYVGEALANSDVDRSELFVTTKIWHDRLDYDGVLESTEESLRKLRLETLDLLYVHWPSGNYDPDETFSAFKELYDRGMTRRIGVSNFTLKQIQEARKHSELPFFAHQLEMHPLLKQDELHRDALEHDMYLVAYSPFRKGTLFDEMEEPILEDIAAERNVTPHQVVLAWLIGKKRVLAIPKASSESHLRQNFEARELELTSGEVERIESIEKESRMVIRPFSPWS